MAHPRKALGGYNVPRKFLFVADDFTVDNGMITRMMKIGRIKVMK